MTTRIAQPATLVDGLDHSDPLAEEHGARYRLTKQILYLAGGFDGPTEEVFELIRKRLNAGGAYLDVEDLICVMQERLASLHAILSPTVSEWMSGFPDVAVEAIDDEPGQATIVDEVLPMLFRRAGIAKRYETIEQQWQRRRGVA